MATLDLNGVAIHSELGEEKYIAALFLEDVTSDARQAILSDQRKRMEVRVLAKRLLTRKFKRLWIEGVAMNSGSGDMKKHAQDLADFSNMLKLKMIAGDTLSIERTFRRGVEISLNGILLGSVSDPTFFDLLLRTWVGPVPPGADFKAGLLGGGSIEPEALDRLESVRTTAARVDDLKRAIAARGGVIGSRVGFAATTPGAAANTQRQGQPEPDTTITAEAISTTTPTPTPTTTPTDTTTTTEPEDTAATAITTLEANTSETSLLETSALDAGVEKPNAAESLAESDANQDEQLAANGTQAVDDNETESAPADSNDSLFEEGEADTELTAADLLSRQLYINKLARETSQKVKYPSGALRRGHEGSVRVDVTINRSGKVLNVTLGSESRYSSLNKAAIRAVKKASPYTDMPSSIPGEQFLFSVPITFRQQPAE